MAVELRTLISSTTQSVKDSHPLPVASMNPKRIRGTLNSVSPGVIAAAGNYAALDVISHSATVGVAWVFDAVARGNGLGGYIVGATIASDSAAMVARTRLYLFDANPSGCNFNDNVANSIVIADQAKLLGYIDFPALVDIGTICAAQNITDRLCFKCASGDDAIYGILVFLDAETNETASMTVDIHLHVDS